MVRRYRFPIASVLRHCRETDSRSDSTTRIERPSLPIKKRESFSKAAASWQRRTATEWSASTASSRTSAWTLATALSPGGWRPGVRYSRRWGEERKSAAVTQSSSRRPPKQNGCGLRPTRPVSPRPMGDRSVRLGEGTHGLSRGCNRVRNRPYVGAIMRCPQLPLLLRELSS